MSTNEIIASPDDIAIIGMAGRFPGAQTIQAFWNNLRDGVEGVSFFSDEELLEAGVPPATLRNPAYVRAHASLLGIDVFDAAFFGISPREAEIMDPQQRLFLECAWEALESAGYIAETQHTRIGVYAGVGTNSYLLHTHYSAGPRPAPVDPFQLMIHSEKDYLATRVSYKLNLKGPAVSIQTACSTSLVAVHLACQSLLNGECALALAGGVTFQVPQKAGYLYQEGGIVSPDGHCRTFDARAQGTVGGDGVGVVVLKPLVAALADRDTIHAVIKGSAINNDGGFKIGYTAPSIDGQAEVIAEAYLVAGVEPETISYVEAHGTATPLGDPIEVAALTRAFRRQTEKKGFCALGSVKTNIGHLDTAAGVAGLIKTTLALEHQLIPPSLHFETPNPEIDFANSPFYVNAQLTPWKRNGAPRRAGVSSFGIGGTNAHLILEEAPVVERSPKARPWQLLLLSARTPGALHIAKENLLTAMKQQPDLQLADVAFTLQVGRKGFEARSMFVARDREDAIRSLEKSEVERPAPQMYRASKRPLTFLFPGQGAQHVHMAKEVYRSEPVFRQQVDRCCDLLGPLLGRDLRSLLYPENEQAAEAARQLTHTSITQAALFVIEYALARLWMFWGVVPESLLGHSIGEFVAACLAGVMTLEDALKLVIIRGQMMQQLPSGMMLAVSLSREKVLPFISEDLSLAAVNAPSRCVVSGPVEAIVLLEEKLMREKVAFQRLLTSHAFHSAMVDPSIKSFVEQVKSVSLHRPRIPFISNVTGTWITDAEATDPAYWGQHMRKTVLFSAGLQTLLHNPEGIFLEVGPGHTLTGMVRQHFAQDTGHLALPSLPRESQAQESDLKSVLNALGNLWVAGIEIDWQAYAADEKRSRVPLPTYPFERKRYWLEAATPSYQDDSLKEVPVPVEQPLARAQTSPAGPSQRQAKIHFMLREMFAHLFGVDQGEVEGGRSFFELGADSLLLLLASQAIRDKFDVAIPFRQLFDAYPTIEKLTAYIDRELRSEELLEELPESAAREEIVSVDLPSEAAVSQADNASISAFPVIIPEVAITGLERALQQQQQVLQNLQASLQTLLANRPQTRLGEGGDEGYVAQIVKATIAELQQRGVLRESLSAVKHAGNGAYHDTSDRSTRAIEGRSFVRWTDNQQAEAASSSPAPLYTAPMTEAQKELWFLTQLGADSSLAYNQSMMLRLRGNLTVTALQSALQDLIQRHEALRTTFSAEGDSQRIFPATSVALPLVDFSVHDEALREDLALEWTAKVAQQPFDLEHGPLLRVHLLRLADQLHLLLFTYHHSIADGWSFGIVVQELSLLYSAYCQGQTIQLPEPLQCRDFALWQARQQSSPEMQKAVSYWQQRFTTSSIPTLDLPVDYPRPSIKTYSGARESLILDASLGNDVLRLSAARQCTLFMLLLAAYNTLLYRLTGQDEVIVAILAAGQAPLGDAPLVGHCVNLLPLRSALSEHQSFSDYVLSVKREVLDAYEHQLYSFGRMVKSLKLARDPGRTPLVSTLFNLDRPSYPAFVGLEVELGINPTGFAKFDLSLNVLQTPQNELHVTCDYNTDLFERTTIQRWLGHFETLLRGIVAAPHRSLATLPVLAKHELDHLLLERNATRMEYPKSSCVHSLFEEQVERTPDAIAVTFEQSHLTYQELNRRANCLAAYLCEQGVRAEARVGICMERSVEMLIAFLAIFKAGGAFVPLDVAFPEERMAYMLADSQAHLLVTQQRLLAKLPGAAEDGSPIKALCLDTDWKIIERASASIRSSVDVRADDLAYIMYTSGSTGKPKGVLIPHFSFVNYLYWTIEAYGPAHGRGAPMQSSIAADAVFPNLFSPLLVGTAVHMLPESHALEALSANLQEKAGFSLLKITPTQLEVLNLQLPSVDASKWVRTLVAGAEALRGDILEFWQANAPTTILLNEYGPTETVVGCSIYRIPPGKTISGPVPIGLPIANIQFYVLDALMQPVPIGVPGELYIGGDGLAWGYLNRPELTASVFVPDPFSDQPGSRLYKTGDIVRYLADPDGNIEFIGRRDHQVKIKGYRVELGEVEGMLTTHPSVLQSAALVREDTPGDKRLVAYVILHPGKQLTTGALRSYIKERLPDYMVPSAFVFLDVLPLTATGKIDTRALPAPERAQAALAGNFVAPGTDQEKKLAEIWEQVLGLARVGIHDNFFELGGDSIMSMRVVSLANKAGISLTPQHIFLHQTIEELLGAVTTAPVAQKEPVTAPGLLSPTPIQCRFFEFELLHPEHWNQSRLVHFTRPVTLPYLARALQTLLAYHDAFRMRARQSESGWQLSLAASAGRIPLQTVDLSDLSGEEQAHTLTAMATRLQASLDIEEGPLVQAAFFISSSQGTGRLLLIIHHLVIDTVSWNILLEDLQTLYTQLHNEQPLRLPPGGTSYQQWAGLLKEYGKGPQVHNELEYWLKLSRQQVSALPADYEGVPGDNTEGSARVFTMTMNRDDTRALLQEIPGFYQVQVNDILLTALVLAITRWTGQKRLLVDLEGHGREALFPGVELSRTVGWFTALFPVCLTHEGQRPAEALKSVQSQLRALPHRGLGYGVLRYLTDDPAIAQELSKLSQAQIVFNYHGRANLAIHAQDRSALFTLATESCGPDRHPQNRRAYLIEVDAVVLDEQLHMYWRYSEHIHREATIATVAQYYEEAMKSLPGRQHVSKQTVSSLPDAFDADISPQDLEAVFTALAEMEEGRNGGR